MFLITTADQRFWKTDEPILFLGEWCKVFSERHIWGKLHYEVLPYHWDDRKKLYYDYLHLNQLYEKVLAQLCTILNKLHSENHSSRYWRIIIGPWLNSFIGILYDRYLSICSAEASGKVTNTLITEYSYEQWIPKHFGEFNEWFRGDEYNHYLYSRIIELASSLNYEKRGVLNTRKPDEDRLERPSISLKSIIKKVLSMYSKFVPDFFNRIVLIESYLNIKDLTLLQLSLGQLPYLYHSGIEIPTSIFDLQKRKEICLDYADNEFMKLLNCLIPEQIPQCYLESYTLLKKKALKEFPSKPQIIFTANAHFHNEGFKMWAASCIEEGTLFIGTQHGGFEGMGLWFSPEDHQNNIWDKYYSWGWEDVSRKNIKPFLTCQLNRLKKIKPNKNGRILMVNNGSIRYSYTMQSMPVASSGYNAYLQDIFKFIHSLGEKPQELLTVRLYPHDFQTCQRERFKQECPNIECYMGKKSMYKQFQESRLFIGNNNCTTYLEAFAANIPSIIFWHPDHWELRYSARPYFDELCHVGILHYAPESAAELVNRIFSDPMSWWLQSEIQEAKNRFCFRFARTSKYWLREWKQELSALARKKG